MLKRHLEKRSGLNQFAVILLGIFFHSVYGDTFLQYLGGLVPGYTVLHLIVTAV
jgi:hypothetical protein